MTAPQLLRIPADRFDDVWPHCAGLMARGIRSAPDLITREIPPRVKDGTMQLWLVVDMPDNVLAVLFTDIAETEQGARVVWAQACGGKQMWRWARLLCDGLARFAKDEGCTALRFMGKRGWGRVLKDCRIVGECSGEQIFERALA